MDKRGIPGHCMHARMLARHQEVNNQPKHQPVHVLFQQGALPSIGLLAMPPGVLKLRAHEPERLRYHAGTVVVVVAAAATFLDLRSALPIAMRPTTVVAMATLLLGAPLLLLGLFALRR